MKKIALLATTLLLSVATTIPVLAGVWTHVDENDYEFENLWFYVKDNGLYAENEWVLDNGTWYWIGSDGYIPVFKGVAKDGHLYNDDGVWIDFSDGKHFATQELYNRLSNNMTFEEVVAIMGKPHYLNSSYEHSYGSKTYQYAEYEWYTQDAKGEVSINFRNGRVSYYSAYWN